MNKDIIDYNKDIIKYSKELEHCLLSKWYPIYKEHTFLTKFINLTEEFKNYLNVDGIILPKNVNFVSYGSTGKSIKCDKYGDYDDDCEPTEYPDNDIEVYGGDFVESGIIDSVIREFGFVVPKLLWKTPKDAIWMNNNILYCDTTATIICMLKSSDCISQEVSVFNEIGLESNNFFIALRKYDKIVNPSMEFRVFVKNRKLVAISQREITKYYDFLEKDKESIKKKIILFYNNVLESTFVLSDFVFDLFVGPKKVILIDISPFYEQVHPLLFEWEEINLFNEVEFRIVNGEDDIRSTATPTNCFSIDLLSLFAHGKIDNLDEAFNESKLCN